MSQSIATSVTAEDLAQAVVGSGITVSNATFSGGAAQKGLFTGGLQAGGLDRTGATGIGFDSGIVLSTGNAGGIFAPGTSGVLDTAYSGAGDADLETLSGTRTFDAATLSFDIVAGNASRIRFDFVFSSSEYPVAPDYSDAFAVLVNGRNAALIPGDGSTVTLANFSTPENMAYYKAAAGNANPFGYATQDLADPIQSLSVVIHAYADVIPNSTNHIKIAIADAGDPSVDSFVFVRGGSLLPALPDTGALPPAPPTVPALLPAADTGVTEDGMTARTTPTLTGTAAPGNTVSLFEGDTLLGTGVADAATGAWSITPGTPMREGAHVVTARSTDAAGRISTLSPAFTLTIDATAPDAPTLAASVPGDSNGAHPTLGGMAEAGSTLTLYDGDVAIGTGMADAATGAWSITPSAALATGGHVITARATDAAGNLSAASGPLTLSIGATTPDKPANLALATASDSGVVGDGITWKALPVLTGTAQFGSTVRLYRDATLIGTGIADATTGAWSIAATSALRPGDNAITATATSRAGTVSAAASLKVTLVVPVLDGSGNPAQGALSAYQGTVAGPQWQFAATTGGTIVAHDDNGLLQGGAGNDAIVAQGGRNVLDGHGGSDFLIGGTGRDSFIADARGGAWNTVAGFKAGDDLTLRGVQGSATFHWVANQGADGFQGATLRGQLTGSDQPFALTMSGLSLADAKRLSAVIGTDADGTSSLRLVAPGTGGEDASYTISTGTIAGTTTGTLDHYSGPVTTLRYQLIQPGDAGVTLVAQASDTFLKSGAGMDALVVRNGDNVLDGGTGSNWLVGGAGNDTFFTDARGGHPVWNTVLNFHEGDSLTMWGYQDGVSSWGWTGLMEGAAGNEGATLRGALDGHNVDFSVTLAGISVAQATALTVATGTAGGQTYLHIQA